MCGARRADAYRASPTHASDPDLDIVVEMCEPRAGKKILDVASGGGHVTRRLRERGAEVVSLDPSPGMHADVLAPAEHIPFADGSFDCVVTRIAPHHFAEIGEAIGEMARVTNAEVVIEDTLYMSEEHEEAEKLRDPSHVRSYSEEEWRELLERRGPRGRARRVLREDARDRTNGSRAPTAPARRPSACASCSRRCRRTAASTWRDTKLIVKARKSQK